MALPKLNDVPEYTIKIPSSGKMVKFRPFLVKEQKVQITNKMDGSKSEVNLETSEDGKTITVDNQ